MQLYAYNYIRSMRKANMRTDYILYETFSNFFFFLLLLGDIRYYNTFI